jgi:hypothetical protein
MLEPTPRMIKLYQEAELAFVSFALTGLPKYKGPAVDAMRAFIDELARAIAREMIQKVLAEHFANGGVVSGPAPTILTNEYMIPKRRAIRLKARAIRKDSRPLRG